MALSDKTRAISRAETQIARIKNGDIAIDQHDLNLCKVSIGPLTREQAKAFAESLFPKFNEARKNNIQGIKEKAMASLLELGVEVSKMIGDTEKDEDL